MRTLIQPVADRPRILITRTRHQASALAEAVARLGAEAILVPMIEVAPPKTFEELDAAIQLLDGGGETVDWLIFTSANAVHALVRRARELDVSLRPRRIAAIGPATAKIIASEGLVPSIGTVLIPEEYVAESLATALLSACDPQQRFLLVRAEEARDVIPAQLIAAGHQVYIAAAYRNITPEGTLLALQQTFARRELYPQVITFTSSSTVRNLFALLASTGMKIPESVALASIGPITSATLRELGYQPTFEADEPTIESLALAIAAHLAMR